MTLQGFFPPPARLRSCSPTSSGAQKFIFLFLYLFYFILKLIPSFFCRYVEYVLAQAMAGNFIYSPLRKSFVSRISSGIKIERYASLSELVALCRLVGPNGLKYVEERLMRHVATTVGEIKVRYSFIFHFSCSSLEITCSLYPAGNDHPEL